VKRDEKHRKLKGVMRVGAFARGLMLRGECSVDLVLMCTGRPDATLFSDISRRMPAKFEELSSQLVYNVSEDVGRAAILVISQVEDHRVQATLTLTSTEMRDPPSSDQSQADQEAGVLHRPSCLAALAALRHTKWFQMVAQGLPSCSILMRVLKDICRRVPAWGVLNSWTLELLVQKSLMSANPDYTRPGDVFRRVMECVASGVFLPGGYGLQDPCEKGLADASSCLSAQERVNITLSAQHALRLIAFGKAHLVLGVDPLPPPGSRREGAGERTAAGGAEEKGGGEAVEPEAKKPRVTEPQE
jgi:zinc finger RNA-binding protein